MHEVNVARETWQNKRRDVTHKTATPRDEFTQHEGARLDRGDMHTIFRSPHHAGLQLHVVELGGFPIVWWQLGAWSCPASIGEA